MNTVNWIQSYTLLLKWQGLKFKTILPFVIGAQFFTGIGTVIGLGYMMPGIDSQTAMFLVTGGPTLSLITLGLVLVPQMVAQAKSSGTLDYMRSFPVPRMAYLAADSCFASIEASLCSANCMCPSSSSFRCEKMFLTDPCR